jgi:hypothetical protein
MNESIIVSKDANCFFEEHCISSKEWPLFAQNAFDLKPGDVVFYEGNLIGYRKL